MQWLSGESKYDGLHIKDVSLVFTNDAKRLFNIDVFDLITQWNPLVSINECVFFLHLSQKTGNWAGTCWYVDQQHQTPANSLFDLFFYISELNLWKQKLTYRCHGQALQKLTHQRGLSCAECHVLGKNIEGLTKDNKADVLTARSQLKPHVAHIREPVPGFCFLPLKKRWFYLDMCKSLRVIIWFAKL